MPTAEPELVPAVELRRFAAAAGHHAGLADPDVERFVDLLVEADLRGIDTHGCARIPAYVRGFTRGLVNPRPALKQVRARGAVVVLDADNGLGGIVGQQAMDLAVELAAEHGVGYVAVRNSNHAGMLAIHVLRAAAQGMVGHFVSNGPPVMAGWGGRDPLVSNNPMAYAFPAGAHPPIVLDMACSAVARGKLRRAAADDVAVPEGWAMDENGLPTTDPHAGMRGLVLPMAGHKGFGLAVVNELLSAVLPGALLSAEVSTAFLAEGAEALDSWRIGHLVVALDVTAFLDRGDYLRRTDELIDRCRRSRPAAGATGVLLPGEPEWRCRAQRLRYGVPVPASTRRALDDAAADWGLTRLADAA